MPPSPKPTIVAITRSPVGAVPAPGTLTLDELKDRFNDWIKSFDPALLGVDPEKPIYVYYVDLQLAGLADPAPQVIAADLPKEPALVPVKSVTLKNPAWIADIDLNLGLTSVKVGLVQVCVSLPDMTLLEDSANYVRNALAMGFSVKVRKQNGDESEPSLPFPVWLPPPLVGAPDWKTSVAIGASDSTTVPDPERISNFLGKLAPEPGSDPKGGDLRWYGMDFIEKNFNSDLQAFKDALALNFLLTDKSSIGTSPATGKPVLALPLPASISTPLAVLRRAGTRLTPSYWDDNCVKFDIPHDASDNEKPGFVVVWRDDIPSRVISFVDVANYVMGKILGMLGQLWDQTVNGQRVTLPIPVPLGDVMKVGVTRLAGEANAALATYLRDRVTIDGTVLPPIIKVQFAFEIVDESTSFRKEDLLDVNHSQLTMGNFQDGLEPGMPGNIGKEIAFKYRPVCSPTPLAPEKSGAFSLQLKVDINIDDDISLLGRMHHIEYQGQLQLGLPVIFQPVPLVIPTLAIFFWHQIQVANDAFLIMLPKGTGLFKDTSGNDVEIHIDAEAQGGFNAMKLNIAAELGRILSMLNLVKDFFPGAGNLPGLDLITTAASAGYAIGTCVIDSNGSVDDLRKCVIFKRELDPRGDQTFFQIISAVVLIGAPKSFSHTEIQCFEFPNFNQNNAKESKIGKVLKLAIPDGQFIAALPDFRDLKLEFNGVDRPIVNTSPAGLTNFNDMITSIKIDTNIP